VRRQTALAAVNDDLNLAVYDTLLAGQLAKSFEEDLARSSLESIRLRPTPRAPGLGEWAA
jgi:hypothetical protein